MRLIKYILVIQRPRWRGVRFSWVGGIGAVGRISIRWAVNSRGGGIEEAMHLGSYYEANPNYPTKGPRIAEVPHGDGPESRLFRNRLYVCVVDSERGSLHRVREIPHAVASPIGLPNRYPMGAAGFCQGSSNVADMALRICN